MRRSFKSARSWKRVDRSSRSSSSGNYNEENEKKPHSLHDHPIPSLDMKKPDSSAPKKPSGWLQALVEFPNLFNCDLDYKITT